MKPLGSLRYWPPASPRPRSCPSSSSASEYLKAFDRCRPCGRSRRPGAGRPCSAPWRPRGRSCSGRRTSRPWQDRRQPWPEPRRAAGRRQGRESAVTSHVLFLLVLGLRLSPRPGGRSAAGRRAGCRDGRRWRSRRGRRDAGRSPRPARSTVTAKTAMPWRARLLDRLARVLERVAALIMVEVVGLAVGEQQQEAVALGAGLELGRGVAQGGAHAGVLRRAAARRSAGAPARPAARRSP